MKKTVFAVQVFGLMAMLPMIVILEMNHVPLHRDTLPERVNKIENTVNASPESRKDRLPGEALNSSVETFLFAMAW